MLDYLPLGRHNVDQAEWHSGRVTGRMPDAMNLAVRYVCCRNAFLYVGISRAGAWLGEVRATAREHDRGADRQDDRADRINTSEDHPASRWRRRISDREQCEIENHIRGVDPTATA